MPKCAELGITQENQFSKSKLCRGMKLIHGCLPQLGHQSWSAFSATVRLGSPRGQEFSLSHTLWGFLFIFFLIFIFCFVLTTSKQIMKGYREKYTCNQSQGFPGGSAVENLSAKRETLIQSLCQEDSLEKEMATHSNTLA